jgi:natural product precursor
MKNKMKLTDLRHVETSKEEMNYIKGGDGVEEGIPWCSPGCNCTASCIYQIGDQQQTFELMTNSRTNGSALNIAIGVISGAISWLL